MRKRTDCPHCVKWSGCWCSKCRNIVSNILRPYYAKRAPLGLWARILDLNIHPKELTKNIIENEIALLLLGK